LTGSHWSTDSALTTPSSELPLLPVVAAATAGALADVADGGAGELCPVERAVEEAVEVRVAALARRWGGVLFISSVDVMHCEGSLSRDKFFF
jgi:hypothetical protein